MKFKIQLSQEEIDHLTRIIKVGHNKARTITRAWILLKSHENLKYSNIIEELHTTNQLIYHVRKRYCEEGLEASLYEKSRPGQPKKVTPNIEAQITALACETPPKGRTAWTISLLQLELHNRFKVSIGWTAIQRTLKAHELKPWKKKCGVSRNLITPISPE